MRHFGRVFASYDCIVAPSGSCVFHMQHHLEADDAGAVRHVQQRTYDSFCVGLQIEPFTMRDAEIAAGLWKQTRALGLSFADRACLAPGLRQGWPVVTADRVWQAPGSRVRLIR